MIPIVLLRIVYYRIILFAVCASLCVSHSGQTIWTNTRAGACTHAHIQFIWIQRLSDEYMFPHVSLCGNFWIYPNINFDAMISLLNMLYECGFYGKLNFHIGNQEVINQLVTVNGLCKRGKHGVRIFSLNYLKNLNWCQFIGISNAWQIWK